MAEPGITATLWTHCSDFCVIYYLLFFHMSIKRADLVYNYRACWVHHTNSCESRRLQITAEVNDIDPVLMNAGGHKNRLITSQIQKSKKLKPICSLLFSRCYKFLRLQLTQDLIHVTSVLTLITNGWKCPRGPGRDREECGGGGLLLLAGAGNGAVMGF